MKTIYANKKEWKIRRIIIEILRACYYFPRYKKFPKYVVHTNYGDTEYMNWKQLMKHELSKEPKNNKS